MSEENKVVEEVTANEESNETQEQETVHEETVADTDSELDPIEREVQERLAKMKSNMDRMASERDEALKKAVEIEQKQKQEKIQRLEEEGKLQEALEMKLAEAQAKLKVFEEENVKLNRDSVVNSALGSLEFRNERSRQMAYRDIVEQLVQNDDGLWVHKTGTNIKDFITAYSKNEDNSFLFRVKANTGAGTSNNSGIPSMEQKKAIGEMTTEEVLALASKGQLGNYSY
mgnify:CR=1 FL=1|jgi:hypothetical protein